MKVKFVVAFLAVLCIIQETLVFVNGDANNSQCKGKCPTHPQSNVEECNKCCEKNHYRFGTCQGTACVCSK